MLLFYFGFGGCLDLEYRGRISGIGYLAFLRTFLIIIFVALGVMLKNPDLIEML